MTKGYTPEVQNMNVRYFINHIPYKKQVEEGSLYIFINCGLLQMRNTVFYYDNFTTFRHLV